MNLKTINDSKLLEVTKSLVNSEREITSQILKYLSEIDARKLYLERGYSSLFAFCTKELGYEESQAQRRINACRLLTEIPLIESKIESGELSLTALSQAQRFFRAEGKNQRSIDLPAKIEILKSLENKSTRECERELIKLSPHAMPAMEVRERQISETHVELKVVLERSTVEKLKKLKDLFSHDESMDMAKLIDKMADHLLAKKDPSLEKRRSQKGPAAPIVTRYIPAFLRREVWKRDQSRCQFKDPLTNRVCLSKYRLQIEHIRPFAMGGENTLSNLELLCSEHNKLRAFKSYGSTHMKKYVPGFLV